MESSNQQLCNNIFEILRKYRLTPSEIEHLLSKIGPAPESENLYEASCDIADLFINENVSLIQASKVFNECYRLFSSQNRKLTSSPG